MSDEESVVRSTSKKETKVTKKATKKEPAPKKKAKSDKEEYKDDGSEEENEPTKNTNQESDSEEVTADHFKKSKIKVPRPEGSPFPDSLAPDSLQFVAELIENNDRDFMRLHAKEWDKTRKDFIDFCKLVMEELCQIDPAVRQDKPNEAVYRQNRDLRFSNDKRPYKGNLSAGFSRQGRKFADAGYYLVLKPGNESFFASGIWQPDATRLQNIRSMIIRNGDLLREALSTDAVKEMFDGESGYRILDPQDKLKVAPKNIAKDHPEIDLLRFRSFVLLKKYTDEEVVSAGFLDKVMDFAEATVPFVTVINSWI